MENKDYKLSKRLFKPNIGFLHIFPHQPKSIKWNRDNFGPLRVPAKGMTIELNGKNLALYKRCIEAYEENKINVKGGKVYINDEHAETYTFKRNYYWPIDRYDRFCLVLHEVCLALNSGSNRRASNCNC